MDYYDSPDSTIRFSKPRAPRTVSVGDLTVTVFDGSRAPFEVRLPAGGGRSLQFGRLENKDIYLSSLLASHNHGSFDWIDGHWWIIDDERSTNGLVFQEHAISRHMLSDGDMIRIDDMKTARPDGVLFLFSSGDGQSRWNSVPIRGREITIGRSPECSIVLPHISVSKVHARIVREGSGFVLIDNNSTNGIVVNQQQVQGRHFLQEKDVISITNSKLIFTSSGIYFRTYQRGISVDVSDVVVRRGRGRKSFITSDHVSLHIRPGELIAVIGGSGAGKSTILNCMCGYLRPSSGQVYINGVDLYHNFDALKKAVGYVPQSDIVYDNLTLYDMLSYTAKLRLPEDVSPAERERNIARAIETVELTEKRGSLIKSLSGGQRKRASIAVELLSDPNLLFLDEPASGLDPGTERSLMHSLRKMADSGKTVILVTHSTLQLKMCDKIVFMGKGGKLCFFGSHDDALRFFGVDNIVDIYSMITDHSAEWSARYNSMAPPAPPPRQSASAPAQHKKDRLKQLGILCSRYLKLVTNDRQRLLLLLAQAPILAVLISFVANDNQFEEYNITKSLLFALSCSAFWVGMLNAIQEICKERTILKREFMTGLSLSAYLGSKIAVLGLMCVIQSLMVTGVFAALVGLPEDGVMMAPFPELLITTFLTAISSASMGLFVSSLFTNADRAMTVAPILLMPQILFSGLIFKLDGFTEGISWFAVCRWSMEGYGTTADLNSLQTTFQMEGLPVPHEAEDFYNYTVGHLLGDWGILLLFTVGFLVISRLVLSNIGREKG